MPESTKNTAGSTTRRRRAEYTQGPPQVNVGNLGFGPQNRALAPQLRPVAGRESPTYKRRAGEVPEWSIGTVSKTVVRASVPWVRIPPSPPASPASTFLWLLERLNPALCSQHYSKRPLTDISLAR